MRASTSQCHSLSCRDGQRREWVGSPRLTKGVPLEDLRNSWPVSSRWAKSDGTKPFMGQRATAGQKTALDAMWRAKTLAEKVGGSTYGGPLVSYILSSVGVVSEGPSHLKGLLVTLPLPATYCGTQIFLPTFPPNQRSELGETSCFLWSQKSKRFAKMYNDDILLAEFVFVLENIFI